MKIEGTNLSRLHQTRGQLVKGETPDTPLTPEEREARLARYRHWLAWIQQRQEALEPETGQKDRKTLWNALSKSGV